MESKRVKTLEEKEFSEDRRKALEEIEIRKYMEKHGEFNYQKAKRELSVSLLKK